jgi:hypothetical protein
MATMKSTLALGIAMLAVGLPLTAAAQPPSPSTGDLELQHKQHRAVVLPKPSPDQVRAEADAAVSEYAATRYPSKVIRETSPVRPSSRPDLDYDVKSGVQSQRLNDALRGR